MSKLSKNAIITGGTRGMGRAVTQTLAEQGYRLAIQFNENTKAADETAAILKEYNTDVCFIKSDFSKGKGEVDKVFLEATKFFGGKTDVLINSAGLCLGTPVDGISECDFDLQFNVNVKAVYFLCTQALSNMNVEGRIINFSGAFTKIPMIKNYSVYLATKGAVELLTRGLACEAAEKKITINAIAPGAVNTEMAKKALDKSHMEKIISQTAMHRLGEPEDIANFIKLLVSKESGWMTGQTIHVNGGWI